ncbi:MAG: alpha/beta fold hydrolase [Anaerolineae bacterium]|nr:alpha/beta fold hydrolase [Anaerolineae bacterium]
MPPIVKLVAEERGQGTPLVLLHGFPFDHRIWQAQVEALSDICRVITPDLRGHGSSPFPDGVYDMDTMAQDVLALLDRLDVRRAIWAGHSMGGYVLMAALRLAPERIMGAAFVATHPLPDSDAKRAQRLDDATEAIRLGSTRIVCGMLDKLFAPSVSATPALAQKTVDIMVNTSPVGVAGALRGMAGRPDSTGTLRSMTVPAVVVVGAEDQIVSLDVARNMADTIPGATLVIVPGAGHMLMLEQPDATTDALRPFIEDVL